MAILSDLEKSILSSIQSGLPLSRTPFEELAGRIGIEDEQLLGTLRKWKAEGKIRRMGAIVNHFRIGQGYGAMVVWRVPEDRIDQVGELFASFAKVSHVYLRLSSEQWPYNIYTMVHASEPADLAKTVETMRFQSEIAEFRVLRTLRELKKSPPVYQGTGNRPEQ